MPEAPYNTPPVQVEAQISASNLGDFAIDMAMASDSLYSGGRSIPQVPANVRVILFKNDPDLANIRQQD